MADFLGGTNDFDEFERASSAFPDISLDGSSDIPSTVPQPAKQSSVGFSFDDFDTEPVPTTNNNVKVTGDDEIEKFESEFPEIEVASPVPAPTIPSQSTFKSPSPFAPRPQPSALASTPILNQPVEEEPEVIREWREKQQEEIKARDETSKAKRQETISKAERAIDEFYEDYARKKERNIRENKDAEADYIASLEASLSGGTTWDRICDLVELQNSQSKTIARTGAGTTDLTRFKEILLRLKRKGDQAPGAAGY
ncbi:hypothetical protein Agabi119p4_2116 [Agaricus bisporus var. burnettii]|uniref:Clathrin light chain n=1 Tax=Agaricus bisporus var. burnettii TaxID=192524 RepID=A0A8H7F8N4_AGABI|nr:hypothetical protein Agabi119p4_2116 [Agaricus bisporus var. burnettii]